jgi:predicted DsbA family dithiol-disulfide isomerase
LVWRPFDLHPEYPPEGIPFAELEARYGGGVADRHRAMFDQAGLPYAGKIEKIPNSRRALMLGELARERGVFAELHPRLFDAYWARGLDIGDERVLVDEGTAVGLDSTDVLQTLRDGRYLDQIEAFTTAAIELGAGGVPAWLVDERFLVPGAQPHEVFEQVLERLGHQPID